MTATLYPVRGNDRPVHSFVPARGAVRSHRRDVADRPTSGSGANYAARRVLATVVVMVVVALGAVAVSTLVEAFSDLGSRPAAATGTSASDAAAPIVRIHVARPGDTLWSIADRYRGEVGQGRFVDALIDTNGGTVIQAGQAVRLP